MHFAGLIEANSMTEQKETEIIKVQSCVCHSAGADISEEGVTSHANDYSTLTAGETVLWSRGLHSKPSSCLEIHNRVM